MSEIWIVKKVIRSLFSNARSRIKVVIQATLSFEIDKSKNDD